MSDSDSIASDVYSHSSFTSASSSHSLQTVSSSSSTAASETESADSLDEPPIDSNESEDENNNEQGKSSSNAKNRERVMKYLRSIPQDEEDESSSDDTEGGEDFPMPGRVLSRAQLRKERKQEKNKGKEKESKLAEKQTERKGKGKEKPTSSQNNRRQNSVWVGNLAFKTTEDDLREFLVNGAGQVTRIHMPLARKDGGPQGNRGFAYVDFATPEGQANAILMSEQPLHGRKLLIKAGDNFEGRPSKKPAAVEDAPSSSSSRVPLHAQKQNNKILASQKEPPAPTLFFGNLGFNTTSEGLREWLVGNCQRQRGQTSKTATEREDENPNSMEVDSEDSRGSELIRKVRMGTFEDSGNCKGFAFVDFASTEAATDALLDMRNHRLDGRNLVVQYASVAAVQRGVHKSHGRAASAAASGKGRKDENKLRGESRMKKRESHDEHQEALPIPQASNAGISIGQKRGRAQKDQDRQSSSKRTRFTGAKGGKPEIGGGGRRDRKGFIKPGAALALAKRESAAIVQSMGKKTTF